MRKTVFIATIEMAINKLGINKMVLNKANLLNTEQYKPVILTFSNKKDSESTVKKLHATGQLNLDLSVLNIYDYYRNKFTQEHDSQKSHQHFEENMMKFEPGYWVQDGEDHARYFINGHYIKYKKWDANGFLSVVDYFDKNRVRISREEFHQDGYKYRETLYHPTNNKKNQENYFTKDGFCFLTIWYNYSTGALQKVFLFDPKFKKVIDFKNLHEFHIHWLNELCQLEAVKPIIIAENPSLAAKVAALEDDLADKVFVLQYGHRMAPFTEGSQHKKSLVPILETIPKGYATVVLTEQQRLDLHKEIGNRGNISVIPNAVETTSPKVEKNDKLFVMVTRFAPVKKVEEAIHAMKVVVEYMPDVMLKIYGEGGQADSYRKLIAELKLKDNVEIHKYTTKIDEVYAEALATILTSESEGMSLSIPESMINGTPVIAYDSDYGPAEYIEDGVNGKLVEAMNREQLAEVMIHAIENPEQLIQMGKTAQQQAEKLFSMELFKERWEEELRKAVEDGPKNNII